MELILTCSSTDVYSSGLESSVPHKESVYLTELGSMEVKSELLENQQSSHVRRSTGNARDVSNHSKRPSRVISLKQCATIETENVLISEPIGRIQSVELKRDKRVKVGQVFNGSVDKEIKHSIKNNISTKKSKTTFKCTFCSKSFKYNRQLLTHHVQDHQNRLHFACARCKIKFATVANLSDHVLIHLDSRLFKCQECSTSFTNQSALANHRCPSVPAVRAIQQSRLSDNLDRLPTCRILLKKIDYVLGQDQPTHVDIKELGNSSDETPRRPSRTQMFSSRVLSVQNKSVCPLNLSDDQLCAFDDSNKECLDQSVTSSVKVKDEPIVVVPANNDDDTQLSLLRTSLRDLHVLEGEKHFKLDIQLDVKSVPNNIIDCSPVEQSVDTSDQNDEPDDTINWSPAQWSVDSGDDTTDWFQDSKLSNKTRNKKRINNSTNNTMSKEHIKKVTSKTKKLLSPNHYDVESGSIADGTSFKKDSSIVKEETYICTQCDKRFSSNFILRRHIKSNHRENGLLVRCNGNGGDTTNDEERPYICLKCGRRFLTEPSLRRHETVKHTGRGQNVCKRCGEAFNTAKDLKVHKHTHKDKHGSELSACTICGKKLTDLALHYRRVHENVRQYNCDQCKRWFFSSTELKQHFIRIHTDVRPYLCPKCGERFAVLTDMHHHMTNTHSSERRMFACTLCDNQYTSHAQLNVHIRIHNDERTFVCPQCDMKFVSSSHMNRHRRRVHEANRYSCDECPRTFAYAGELASHKLIHAPTRSYECTLCDKTFKLGSYLRTHIRTWHSENKRALMCPVCGKTFTARGSLVVHAQLHTGVRRFTCPMCEKKFTKSYDVKVHVRQVHTNDRPYPCSHCGRRFASKGNMKNHELIHAGKELHGCMQCEEKFVFHKSLTKHVEQNHPRVSVKQEWITME